MKKTLGNLYGLLGNNQIYEDEYDSLVEGLGNLAKLPIIIDDTPASELTPTRIRSVLRRISSDKGELGLVVLDYIQKLGDRAAGNRVQAIGKYSGACNSHYAGLNVTRKITEGLAIAMSLGSFNSDKINLISNFKKQVDFDSIFVKDTETANSLLTFLFQKKYKNRTEIKAVFNCEQKKLKYHHLILKNVVKTTDKKSKKIVDKATIVLEKKSNKIESEKKKAGRFILATNVLENLSSSEILTAYKGQQYILNLKRAKNNILLFSYSQ